MTMCSLTILMDFPDEINNIIIDYVGYSIELLNNGMWSDNVLVNFYKEFELDLSLVYANFRLFKYVDKFRKLINVDDASYIHGLHTVGFAIGLV